MAFVPNLPKKIQYFSTLPLDEINQFCEKTTIEKFVGGRPGYAKTDLFRALLVKKVAHWSYRTVSEMSHISHSTLVRANQYFQKKQLYEKYFTYLVKQGYKHTLIRGTYVAMDSSFVHTFSKRGELGSEGWNEHKKGYGFKLHLLIDCETQFPVSVCMTNGIANDMTLAIPLLKKARYWLRHTKYVLGDKGYDWGDLINWIVRKLHAKAGIPIKKYHRGKNYSWVGSWRNFQEKAKGRTLKKSIYNRRSAVERVFSVLKRTYHIGKEETRGIVNFVKNCYLALIAYMLMLFHKAKIT